METNSAAFKCCRLSGNTSFCTESKECLEYELVCKTDEYEVSELQHLHHMATKLLLLTQRCSVFVFRFGTTAPLAGCQLMQKPISWESVQPWPSEDFSSTSTAPTKEVRRRQTGGKSPSTESVCYIYLHLCVCSCTDGDDRPCPGEDPRGDNNVGASYLHAELPAASSLSGQTSGTHQRQGEPGHVCNVILMVYREHCFLQSCSRCLHACLCLSCISLRCRR